MSHHVRSAEAPTGAAPLRRVVQRRVDEPLEHRTRPCARCPWRRDADLTAFTDADMAMLRGSDGRPGDEAPPTAPNVACHRDQPGTAHAWRLCAGWLAVVGHSHLGIRATAMAGGLPHTALAPGDGWPELYGSLSELETARNAQLDRAAGRRPTDAQLPDPTPPSA
ncbi:DUF6283 family protein [Streptomyces albus]|uniref:DUF6283 family protein n=1 Tax=Streptomyces albus TaxID=1888 RepID=UPI0033F8B3CA